MGPCVNLFVLLRDFLLSQVPLPGCHLSCGDRAREAQTRGQIEGLSLILDFLGLQNGEF